MATKNPAEAPDASTPFPARRKGTRMDTMIDFVLLAERVGPVPAARFFVRRFRDASFDDRLLLALWIACHLDHKLENPPPPEESGEPFDPENPPPLDDFCIVCGARVYVSAERPGIEGSAVEVACLKNVGSRAEN